MTKTIGWEELRIKRFKVNEEQNHGLENHVDVYSHAHAKRFLCLMVYLNDDFEDGETYFPLFDVGVKPKQGRLFIFPLHGTTFIEVTPLVAPLKEVPNTL